jgi:AcrR family transcriptional regulator
VATASSADPPPGRTRWAGVPAADRKAARRDLLLDAALELLGTEGWRATTVRGVCQAARLNPRYFYESFQDLDALVVAVFDRVAGEAVAATVAEVARCPPEEEAIARTGIGSFVRFVTGDPRRARVLFMEGFANEALGRRRFDTLHEMADTLIADALRQAAENQGVPVEPTSTLVVAINLFVGGLAELVMSWVTGRLEVSLDDLIEDAVALFLAIAAAVGPIEERRREAGATAG